MTEDKEEQLHRALAELDSLRKQLLARNTQRHDAFLCAALSGILARESITGPDSISELVDVATAVADEVSLRLTDWTQELEDDD